MAYRWEFTIHGVDVHVQNEPNPIATREELDAVGYGYPNPRRNTQGTKVRQNSGANWFHFAIPTPTRLGSLVRSERAEAFCWGNINEHADIERMRVWSGGVPRARRLVAEDALAISGDFQISVDFAGAPDDPLVMSIYVLFKRGGEVNFGGAGVRFYTED